MTTTEPPAADPAQAPSVAAAVTFRPARRDDVQAIVALLADDPLGAAREDVAQMAAYRQAFERIQQSSDTTLFVGEYAGRVVATYQLSIMPGLSNAGRTRAQIESVRVAADLRSAGIGARLIANAEARARAAGATILQLTTHNMRKRAHTFYDRLGFTASHIGYKRDLD